MHKSLKVLSLALATVAVVHTTAKADFADGDLIIYFLQSGGTNTVAVDLGAAYTFRNTSVNQLNIVNINSLLSNGTTGFGSTWYNDPTLFWGAAGCLSQSTSPVSQNGDVFRTIYSTKGRATIGTVGSPSSNAATNLGANAMTTGATAVRTQNTHFGTAAGSSAATGFAEDTSTSNIDNQNPFTAGNPGQAFSLFAGGVITPFSAGTFGTFGGVNAESALDLYRFVPLTGVSGEVDGTLRSGDYMGTFVISQTGNISFIALVPEPSSALLMGASALLCGFIRRRRSAA